MVNGFEWLSMFISWMTHNSTRRRSAWILENRHYLWHHHEPQKCKYSSFKLFLHLTNAGFIFNKDELKITKCFIKFQKRVTKKIVRKGEHRKDEASRLWNDWIFRLDLKKTFDQNKSIQLRSDRKWALSLFFLSYSFLKKFLKKWNDREMNLNWYALLFSFYNRLKMVLFCYEVGANRFSHC